MDLHLPHLHIPRLYLAATSVAQPGIRQRFRTRRFLFTLQPHNFVV
jgi:hypothetical protein